MRIVALTRYGRLGASSRVRTLHYVTRLEALGLRVDVQPLTSDAMLERFYTTGRRSKSAYIASILRRLWALWGARHADLVWLEKEAFPYLPDWAELWLKKVRVPYVVDFDDAIFHNYDNNPNRVIRQCFKRKIARIMQNAEIVFVGNEYIADYARRAGAPRVERLPTVVDCFRYRPLHDRGNPSFTIGWIGTPHTSQYLSLLEAVTPVLGQELPASRLVLVGARDTALKSIPVEHRNWSEETEVSDVQSFDVGVMPLFDGPIERGKCGYKLIQYMACGLPVVASPVGVNCEIVTGDTGFLAKSPMEWVSALRRLRDDAALRERMGQSGRALVERRFSLAVTAPRLARMLKEAAGKRSLPERFTSCEDAGSN